MKKLIGIHGKPRAGKDTLAHFFINFGYLRYGPGDPVKQATAAMFNVDIDNLYQDDLKDTTDPFWQISYREMMQKVGKESSRDVFGEDFWMRHIERKLQLLPDYVPGLILPDIRYANEIKWVRERGGIVIFITRKNRTVIADETHAAEQGLPEELADYTIKNDGTINELHNEAGILAVAHGLVDKDRLALYNQHRESTHDLVVK